MESLNLSTILEPVFMAGLSLRAISSLENLGKGLPCFMPPPSGFVIANFLPFTGHIPKVTSTGQCVSTRN